MIKLLDTEVVSDAPQEKPSNVVQVVKVGKEMQLHIHCSDGSVLGVNAVLPEARNRMPVKSFVNGLHGGVLTWLE